MADAVDLGSTAERRRGSSPLPCTKLELQGKAVVIRVAVTMRVEVADDSADD